MAPHTILYIYRHLKLYYMYIGTSYYTIHILAPQTILHLYLHLILYYTYIGTSYYTTLIWAPHTILYIYWHLILYYTYTGTSYYTILILEDSPQINVSVAYCKLIGDNYFFFCWKDVTNVPNSQNQKRPYLSKYLYKKKHYFRKLDWIFISY